MAQDLDLSLMCQDRKWLTGFCCESLEDGTKCGIQPVVRPEEG